MIPALPVEPESITTFPKAPATLGRDERRQCRNHRRIAPGPVHERPVVRGPAQSHRRTGPLNRKAALRDQMRDDLPPLSGP